MSSMNWARMAFVFVLAILLVGAFALGGMFAPATVSLAAPVSQGSQPPDGWHENKVGWPVSGANLVDPVCNGTYALDVNTVVKRFDTFGAAEVERAGREATYWCEPVAAPAAEPTARPAAQPTARPTAAPAESGTGAGIVLMVISPITARETAALQAFDWEMWLSGGSPIVVSNGRAVGNVGSATSFGVELLADIDLSGLTGTIVVLEPWRAGCGATLKSGIPQSQDPNCNPGAAWLFSSWKAAIEWTVDNNWPEYSMWYRPDDATSTDAVKTCVAALVPAGTALNIAPDKDGEWQVCPSGFVDPPWLVEAMNNYKFLNK